MRHEEKSARAKHRDHVAGEIACLWERCRAAVLSRGWENLGGDHERKTVSVPL